MPEESPIYEGTPPQHHVGDSNSPYSVLVHSAVSLRDDSPFKHESSTTQKSKRRRTSPHDHAVLEAAYQKNSKPDKAERAEIVSRVQLGEKEVQIWFQNRRQNDRRRSKPLQPHELLAHIRSIPSGVTIPAVDEVHTEEIERTLKHPVPIQHSHPNPPLPALSGIHSSKPNATDLQEILNPASSCETVTSEAVNSAVSSQHTQELTPPSTLGVSDDTISSNPEEHHLLDSGIVQSGMGRKRDHQQMLDDKQTKVLEIIKSVEVTSESAKLPLKRSSSNVRLSVTADGAVKIRTNDEPTPSPPKQRCPPTQASARPPCRSTSSQNTSEDIQIFKDIDRSKSKQIGAGFGRSRDARTWEFYCDSSVRDALSMQLQADRNGSAVGAIHLIRSNSSKGRLHALSPAPARGNTRLGSAPPKSEKPKLSRARSSYARLQNSKMEQTSLKSVTQQTKDQRSPSADSDKENWAPGTQTSDHPLRRTQPSANHRPILRENEGIIFQDPSASSPRRIRNNDRGSKSGKANTGGEDLDCIQGLLSLSQGAWR